MYTTFDKKSADRIVSAVNVVETQWTENQIDRWGRRGIVPTQPIHGFATTDIRYNGSGLIALSEGTPTNESATDAELTAHNTLRPTIWGGSPCLITPPRVDSSSAAASWHIARAYSATQLSGTSSDDTRGPGYGMLTSLSPMDGHFGWPAVPVFVLAGYHLTAGMGVLADWNESAFRWETIGCCVGEDEGSLLCVGCSDLETSTYNVTLSGITNDGCTECGDFNDTFTLTQISPYCIFTADITSSVDSCLFPNGSWPLENHLQMEFTQTPGGLFTAAVNLLINWRVPSGWQRLRWEYTGATAQEACGQFAAKGIPYSSTFGLGYCDGTGSTCTISAV